MNKKKVKPLEKVLKQEHLVFLDDLRESGSMQLYEAVPKLMKQFSKLNVMQAAYIAHQWRITFHDRQQRSSKKFKEVQRD